jgi:membrane-associated phospholipid phosphatase
MTRAARYLLRTLLPVPSKWAVLIIFVVSDITWMRLKGMSVNGHNLVWDALLTGVLLSVPLAGRQRYGNELKKLCTAAAFGLILATSAGILMYLAMSENFPLVDASLARADAALGFDWLAYDAWVMAHPTFSGIMFLAYSSLGVQIALVLVFLSLTSRFERLDNYLMLTSVLLLITIVIGVFFPAQCPGKFFHPMNQSYYDSSFSHLELLRSGQMKLIDLGNIQGLICIPSFHAVSAFLFCWSARRTALFYFIFPLNVLMLLATPVFGGHYLVDVLSGLLLAGTTACAFADKRKRIQFGRLGKLTTRTTAMPVTRHKAQSGAELCASTDDKFRFDK